MIGPRALGLVACAVVQAACAQIVGVGEIVEGPCEADQPIDFTQLVLPSSSVDRIEGVTAADLNGDGRLELIVRRTRAEDGFARTSVLIATTVGDATPSYATEIALADDRAHMVDLNGDGRPDRIVECTGSCDQIAFNTTPAGAATLTFVAVDVQGLPAGRLGLGDWTGDGRPDAVSSSANTVTLSPNTTPAGAAIVRFDTGILIRFSQLVRGAELVDLDGDGRRDLLTVLSEYDTSGVERFTLRAARNTSTAAQPSFAPPGEALAMLGRSARYLLSDVDLDGKLDLVIGDRAGARLWRNTTQALDPTPAFAATPALACAGDPVAAYDIDRDGRPDLVFAEPRGPICALVNTTAAGEPPSFGAHTVGNTGFAALYGIADVNRDGAPDVIAYGNVTPLVLMASGSHCPP